MNEHAGKGKMLCCSFFSFSFPRAPPFNRKREVRSHSTLTMMGIEKVFHNNHQALAKLNLKVVLSTSSQNPVC